MSTDRIGTPPLVSISVTSYQHAPFLAACLDGILMQECDFTYEVLLGEDGSTDGSREIAQRYAAAHPDRIRLFLHDRSNVIHIDGRPTGRYNLLNNLRHARGRYLCHIDGDDHWTDPDRLRIMVELMEAEPDLGMAFHNAWNVWDDDRKVPYLDPARAKPRYTRGELTIENFIPTSGAIWRWNALTDLPAAFHKAPFGDWMINIHFAGVGPIGFMDRIMSVRHVHGSGAMTAMGALRTYRGVALAYEVMRTQVQDDLAPEALARWTKQITDGFDQAINSGDREHALWFLAHARLVPKNAVPLRMRSRWWALVHFPRTMALYKQLRSRA